jgi:hypothetical protein
MNDWFSVVQVVNGQPSVHLVKGKDNAIQRCLQILKEDGVLKGDAEEILERVGSYHYGIDCGIGLLPLLQNDIVIQPAPAAAAPEAPVRSTLELLLEQWDVLDPGMWENDQTKTLGDWYAVTGPDGIVAYFGNETDAFRFRLDKVNRILNP